MVTDIKESEAEILLMSLCMDLFACVDTYICVHMCVCICIFFLICIGEVKTVFLGSLQNLCMSSHFFTVFP